MREGTIVDATIIAAPPSTKNKAQERDPEMHQTKKGNEWHFGLKAHIGADAESGPVHMVTVTADNVADIAETHALLHGQEQVVFAAKRGRIRALAEGALKTALQLREKLKAQVRAAVEPPFHIVKNLFRHGKTRCRGLAKNLAQLQTLFALANLVIAKRALLAPTMA